MEKNSFDKTKQHLIETAERLFAEKGVDGVSLRQINVAAGQRNASALHYHFGSRESLIEAIFAYRMTPVDERRLAMVEELKASGRTGDLRALVETKVRPLAEQLDLHSDRNNYIRFYAQIYTNPKIEFRTAITSGKIDRGIRQANQMVLINLQHLPERLLRQRLAIATGQTIFALADLERHLQQNLSPAARENFDLEMVINNLIDMETGALSAPISAETRQYLKR